MQILFGDGKDGPGTAETLPVEAGRDMMESERMVTGRGAREETKEAFLRRAAGDGYEVYEGKAAVYGYRRPVQRGDQSGSREEASCAVQAQEELRQLGIDAEIIDGDILYNRNGITQVKAVPQAVTVEKSRIFISNHADIAPRNIAGHEAFHLWKYFAERDAYIEVLVDNLLFSSKAFREVQSTIAAAYLGEEADLSDAVQVEKLCEELFAYISGDIHEGTHDASLREMFRDYDAVKAAWETLIRSAPTANPTGDGDSLMQEIRRLYDENSDAPETLPESEDAFLRGFQDDGDGPGRLGPTAADLAEFAELQAILGVDAPKSIAEFLDLKYNDQDGWERLETQKEQTVFVESAPCVTTPKKYTGYFLKPETKHADEFFDVGYTQDNPLQLRYDMARQFDMEKAVYFSIDEDGKERFRIYMDLGVGTKKRFRTAWIKDNPDSKPRIVTAFRENE